MSRVGFGLHCCPAAAGSAYLHLEDALHMVRCSGADYACLPLRDEVFFLDAKDGSSPPERSPEEQQEIVASLEQLPLRDAVGPSDSSRVRLLKLLSSSGAWSRYIVGVATEKAWSEKVVEQMRLASFLGLPAVVVPCPSPSSSSAEDGGMSLACVAKTIREFMALASTAVWLSCDATSARQHEVYNNLRGLLGLNEVAVMSSSRWVEAEMRDGLGAARSGKVHVFLTLPILRMAEGGRQYEACWLGESIAAFCCEEPVEVRTADELQAQGQLPEWGSGCYTPRLPRSSFEVYLLRHRAVPTIPYSTVESVTAGIQALTQAQMCLAGAEAHEGHDFFLGLEDVCQLPLQPLGHHLPNGVYDTFEKDTPKYAAYGKALLAYMNDWKKQGERKEPLRVAVLGAGRGPLVTQVMHAATFHNIKACITAIEKNPEAGKYLALKLRCDPLWQQFQELYGHEIRLLQCDGRVAAAQLPDGGACDVVVSELLGSLGDNELSPECIDGFLRGLQGPTAAHVVSIPQSYTSYVAPVHSAALADEVTQAAVSGVHSISFDRQAGDRHACIAHQVFVVNIAKAMLLSPPQPALTFSHVALKEEGSANDKARCTNKNKMTFTMAHSGRLDGIAGYFHSVLYRPVAVDDAAGPIDIVLSTVPTKREPQNMFSWFPAFIPMPRRFHVREGDTVDIEVSRNTIAERRDEDVATGGGQMVAYEWLVTRHCAAAAAGGGGGGVADDSVHINESGWAAAVVLSAP